MISFESHFDYYLEKYVWINFKGLINIYDLFHGELL